MAFDGAMVEKIEMNQSIVALSLPSSSHEKGWAAANPDRALAFLFVAQCDDGLIEEILAA